MMSLRKKVVLLLTASLLSVGASTVFANDAQKGLYIHSGETDDTALMYYNSETDRWYFAYDNGKIIDSVDGKYLRNQAVTKVTNGVAQETQDRQNAFSAESKSQQDADKKLSDQLMAVENNGVSYDDDTHSTVSLSPTGTKITNVKSGNVANGSTDAVTGSQLYERAQKVKQVTSDREAHVAKEMDARKKADAELDKRIGSLSGKQSNYLNSSESLSSNLSRLDAKADSIAKATTKEANDFTEALAKQQKERMDGDTELDEAIGKMDGTKSTNYVKQNKTLNDNLLTLDQTITPLKDKLTAEKDKNAHAFDNEIAEREKADKALLDRIGSFGDTDTVIYLDKNVPVSKNLVALDKENKNTADAIQKEIAERKAQMVEASAHFNGRVEGMKQEIATIGADGAALAALQYDDYDPKSKWSFSASQGNYRNKNSSAVGIRYFFGANSSMQLATTLGQRKNLWGGSVTVRPGSPSKEKEISPEMKELMEINKIAHKMQVQKSNIETTLFGDDEGKEDKHVTF